MLLGGLYSTLGYANRLLNDIVLPFPLAPEDCPVLLAIFSSSPGVRGGSLPCGSFPGTSAPVFAANSSTLK